MRIVGNIPHPDIRITVFHMNEKYMVKLEAGPMEQVFKFDQEKYPGFDAIKKLVDEVFISNALKRFNEMFLEMRSAEERMKDEGLKIKD
ncbi:MAG: hypothetical protein NT084_11995 [Bacteroidetes bacterium]|jgi:hypothetical protein|nr:hypothetical protein [Bacteroidota bacterium]